MLYFTCPANLNHRQQVSALDPTFKQFLSQIIRGSSSANESTNESCETKIDSSTTGPRHSAPGSSMRNYPTFTPNFDVIETEDSYHLEGELPGVADTRDVEIGVEDNTLSIRGRIEKFKQGSTPAATNTPPAAASEESPKELKRRSLNPTVEDTSDEDDFAVISSTSAASETNKTKEVSTESEAQKRQQNVSNKPQDGGKVWLSERSFGSFQRSFWFPTRVDVDGVTARLENGLLMIKVPKVLFSGVRRIHIG